MAVLCIISCLIKHFNEAYANRGPLTTETARGTDETGAKIHFLITVDTWKYTFAASF